MNKKLALTLAEIMIIMFIVGIIATCLIMVFRPKLANTNIYNIRATIYNIEKVNEHLLSVIRENGGWSFEGGTNPIEKYCNSFADAVSIKGIANCNTTSVGDVNFTFPNGVEISGLTNSGWENNTNSLGGTFYYKDIEFDANGDGSGKDTIGHDKFQVRILKNEPYVIPLNDFINENKLVRFSVVSHPRNEKYEKIQGTEQGVSFGHAACITGLADNFLTDAEKNNIEIKDTSCDAVRNNTKTKCPRYFDCSIYILDVPTYAGVFTVRNNN